MKNIVKLLIAVTMTLQTFDVNADLYKDRPKVTALKTSGKPYTLTKELKEFLDGSILTAAMLLEVYKDYHMYFLARDAEVVYDVTTLLAKAKELRRLHLANVSTDLSYYETQTKQYLEQFGLGSKDQKYVVFIDSGFSGSIIDKIKKLRFKNKSEMLGHLLASNTEEYPSTRTFCAGGKGCYEDRSAFVQALEDYTHYTDTANEFQQDKSKIEASSADTNTSVKNQALKIMRGTKVYILKNENKLRFKNVRKIWSQLVTVSKSENMTALKTLLKKLLIHSYATEDKIYEAIVFDFINLVRSQKHFTEKVNNIEIGDILAQNVKYNPKEIDPKTKVSQEDLKDMRRGKEEVRLGVDVMESFGEDFEGEEDKTIEFLEQMIKTYKPKDAKDAYGFFDKVIDKAEDHGDLTREFFESLYHGIKSLPKGKEQIDLILDFSELLFSDRNNFDVFKKMMTFAAPLYKNDSEFVADFLRLVEKNRYQDLDQMMAVMLKLDAIYTDEKLLSKFLVFAASRGISEETVYQMAREIPKRNSPKEALVLLQKLKSKLQSDYQYNHLQAHVEKKIKALKKGDKNATSCPIIFER